VQQKYTFYKSLESRAKQGIPRQNKEKQNNDKNTICLPWHNANIFVEPLILLGFWALDKSKYQEFTKFENIEISTCDVMK